MRAAYKGAFISIALSIGFFAITSPGCSCHQQPLPEQATKSSPPKEAPPATEQKPEVAKEESSPDSRTDEQAKSSAETSRADASETADPASNERAGDSQANGAGADSDASSTHDASGKQPPGASRGTAPALSSHAKQDPAKPSGSPVDARKTAIKLAKAARKSAADGDFAEAFRDARAGWEAVAGFANDSQCQALAKSLLKDMSQYAGKANQRLDATATGKTLVVE